MTNTEHLQTLKDEYWKVMNEENYKPLNENGRLREISFFRYCWLKCITPQEYDNWNIYIEGWGDINHLLPNQRFEDSIDLLLEKRPEYSSYGDEELRGVCEEVFNERVKPVLNAPPRRYVVLKNYE